MKRVRTYSRFVKLEHTLFSFPLLLSGALLARGELSIRTLLLILAAGTGARTAALGLNRILDRRIDALNPRTENRELPSGAMTSREALGGDRRGDRDSFSHPPISSRRGASRSHPYRSPSSSRIRS